MALNSFTPNTKIESAKVTANDQNLSDHGRHVNLKWTFRGNLFTQTSPDYLSLPDDVTWERADLNMSTAPVGQNVIVDIERSTDSGATWVTIFTNSANRPSVTAGNKTGSTTTVDVQNATALTHLFRAKISQIGTTTPGADLTVILRGNYDLD